MSIKPNLVFSPEETNRFLRVLFLGLFHRLCVFLGTHLGFLTTGTLHKFMIAPDENVAEFIEVDFAVLHTTGTL